MNLLGLIIWCLQSLASRLAEGCATKSHCFSKALIAFGTFSPLCLCGSAAIVYPRACFPRVPYSQIIWHLGGVRAASLICSLIPSDRPLHTDREGMLIPQWVGHTPRLNSCARKESTSWLPSPGFPVLFHSNQILLSPALWDITSFNTCQKQLMVRVFFPLLVFRGEINSKYSDLSPDVTFSRKTENRKWQHQR